MWVSGLVAWFDNSNCWHRIKTNSLKLEHANPVMSSWMLMIFCRVAAFRYSLFNVKMIISAFESTLFHRKREAMTNEEPKTKRKAGTRDREPTDGPTDTLSGMQRRVNATKEL